MPPKNSTPPTVREVLAENREALLRLSDQLNVDPDVMRRLKERLNVDPDVMRRLKERLNIDPDVMRRLRGTLMNARHQQESVKQRGGRRQAVIPHLDEAIDQLLQEEKKKPRRRLSPKADAGRVIDILKKQHAVLVPTKQEKTVQRRIAVRRRTNAD
jgi:hypothetical protein